MTTERMLGLTENPVASIRLYMQSLPDNALDQIIEAQKWCTGRIDADDGYKCLIGHGGLGRAWYGPLQSAAALCFDTLAQEGHYLSPGTPLPLNSDAVRFCKDLAAAEIDRRAKRQEELAEAVI